MSQSLFSPFRDSSLVNQSLSLFSTPNSSPLLSSTPHKVPSTQEFAERLVGLRAIDLGPDPLKRENEELKLQLDDAKSELVALRLQLEENENEILRLRQQQQPPSSLPTPPSSLPALPPPPPPLPPFGYSPVTSKRKRQRQKKAAKATAAVLATSTSAVAASTSAVAASTSAVPASTSAVAALTTATTRPPLLPPPSTSRRTVHVFHDSNLKGISEDELRSTINHLSTNSDDNYNITLHSTYCLHPTLKQIQQMTFNRNDVVVINIMTNDARPTQHRQKRTTTETTRLLSSILNLLLAQLPRSNIVVLEAPPQLYNDVYPYNLAAHHLALQLGVRFGQTLIGEDHMQHFDGIHIKKAAKTLLAKTIAAAVCDKNPHLHFSLQRPPHGIYGPWAAPAGVGMMPFSKMATSSPINFRRSNWRRPAIRPLMSVNIRSH